MTRVDLDVSITLHKQQWMELFPQIADAGKGILDRAIVDHARKSGVEHFIIENDAIVNPTESLTQGYKYLSSL